jgi:hypothetical protein
VAYLTVALSVAVVALGLLLLVLAYAAHTHSAARWAAAIDAHNRGVPREVQPDLTSPSGLVAARWDAERRAFVTFGEDAA